MKVKKIWILTLFPDYFVPFLEWGVIGKVLSGERLIQFDSKEIKLEVKLIRLGDYCTKGHKGLDDSPYGGGPGMLFRADRLKEILDKAVIKGGNYDLQNWRDELFVIFTSPRGEVWEQNVAKEYAQTFFLESSKDLVFICGRYEGIDERFLEKYVDFEFSIGDYVLSGGELAVMVCLDSMLRNLNGTLGDQDSLLEEAFNDSKNGLLEGPQYTRPREFEGLEVPSVYLNGHGAEINVYKQKEALRITKIWRPDLLKEE